MGWLIQGSRISNNFLLPQGRKDWLRWSKNQGIPRKLVVEENQRPIGSSRSRRIWKTSIWRQSLNRFPWWCLKCWRTISQQIGRFWRLQQYKIINSAYYIANVGKTAGSVEIFRPFDEVATYEQADDKLEAWIRSNERPPVVPFDDRTIGEMFSQVKPGVCLFNKEGSAELLDIFTQSAKAAR